MITEYSQTLEQRTLNFSLAVLRYVKSQKLTFSNRNYFEQVLRSSSSTGANYREANNALSFKDCLHRFRIVRKEINETLYWLQILKQLDPRNGTLDDLIQECSELLKIFSVIIRKKKNIQDEF